MKNDPHTNLLSLGGGESSEGINWTHHHRFRTRTPILCGDASPLREAVPRVRLSSFSGRCDDLICRPASAEIEATYSLWLGHPMPTM